LGPNQEALQHRERLEHNRLKFVGIDGKGRVLVNGFHEGAYLATASEV